jgi:hypothetical protein
MRILDERREALVERERNLLERFIGYEISAPARDRFFERAPLCMTTSSLSGPYCLLEPV